MRRQTKHLAALKSKGQKGNPSPRTMPSSKQYVALPDSLVPHMAVRVHPGNTQLTKPWLVLSWCLRVPAAHGSTMPSPCLPQWVTAVIRAPGRPTHANNMQSSTAHSFWVTSTLNPSMGPCLVHRTASCPWSSAMTARRRHPSCPHRTLWSPAAFLGRSARGLPTPRSIPAANAFRSRSPLVMCVHLFTAHNRCRC